MPHPGTVIWWGGGDVPTKVFDRFAKLAPGKPIAVVAAKDRFSAALQEWAKTSEHPLETLSPGLSGLSEKLSTFDGAWIEAIDLSADTDVLDSLLVSAEFLGKPPSETLVAALESRPGLVGIGIPSGTALIASGRRLDVVGAADVVFCLPASASRPKDRPMAQWIRKPGSEDDLIALRRAAIARRGAAFPSEPSKLPVVPSGTLFPCGGGDLPDSIWLRFVDLAGGINAPIVVIPIATPQPDDPNPKGADRLKQLGCQRITVLNQNTVEGVQSPEFIAALKEATGVWFVGGRQWKYLDAYEGSIAEPLFRDILKRGGVIGGSSAGAAVQAEYMVRGSPLGNREIMAEGYEQGLNFLPGCAIDIHLKQRRRLNDLIELVQFYPQLLGIGLDEDTAAEIRGSDMTAHGDGSIHIVDSRAPAPIELKSGESYDMANRKRRD